MFAAAWFLRDMPATRPKSRITRPRPKGRGKVCKHHCLPMQPSESPHFQIIVNTIRYFDRHLFTRSMHARCSSIDYVNSTSDRFSGQATGLRFEVLNNERQKEQRVARNCRERLLARKLRARLLSLRAVAANCRLYTSPFIPRCALLYVQQEPTGTRAGIGTPLRPAPA